MHFDRNPLFVRIRGKNHNDFKFGTFIGRQPSDGAACVAVKGLNSAATAHLVNIENAPCKAATVTSK